MALGTEPYRHLYAADLTALRDLSVMAERVYVHLACGERSSACCMASCDPEHLRYSVRARRASEVMDALAELESAGWLVLDLAAKQAWLPVQAKRTWIVSDTSATGWRNDLSRFKVSVATRQAAAFIDSAPVPHPKGHGSTPDLRSRNSSSNRNSIPSVAKATDTPAVAVDPKPKRAKADKPKQEIPPDLGETIALFASLGSTENEAHKCYLYFKSKDWKRGRDPIKNWKATCEGWVRNSYGQQGRGLSPPRAVEPTDPDDIVEDDGFTPRQRREAEAQLARMKKENDEYDAAQLAKRSQAGLFGPQR